MSNQTINKMDSISYDPHLVPAETAARLNREDGSFKQSPSGDSTTGGYTVDNEGLVNNYAVEPEPYVNEPGDQRQKS